MQSLIYFTQVPVLQRIGLLMLHLDAIRGLINKNRLSLNEFKSVFETTQSSALSVHKPSAMHLTGYFSGQY
jgi:hypothetical protein